MSNVNKEKTQRIVENYLYLLGHERAKIICDEFEMDEEIQNIEVPESIDKWFEDFNRKYKKKQRNIARRKMGLIYGKRIASIMLVLLLSFTVLTVSVEAFRHRVISFIMEVYDEYTAIQFIGSDNDMKKVSTGSSLYAYPTHIPVGFEVDDINDSGNLKSILFINESEQYIRLMQAPLEVRISIDTEDAITKSFEINGFEALLVNKLDLYQIIWHDEQYVYHIISNYEVNAILKLARSVSLLK
ncbi:uncharacterized protein DUF4367 [Natranaerovirga pectinivora]|uniref:Uncharacterized protein DUF4367 n=1 Tax=Natranaerovirga pectinivora TaxID=682400 RepID=A0A4R3ML40_9FIRM|nr:DUF4367 domain-containing protein [Natranaerovirga pectinivora]TCT14272.1 uncharacterized protein DUF4367 [Natranaerovirga pectinivora]